MTATVPQVLTGAKAALVNVGWITDEMRSPHGYCLAGAAQYVAGNLDGQVAAAALDTLVAALAARGYCAPPATGDVSLNIITYWNDHRCKGIDDAVALIDEALLLAAPTRASLLPVRRSRVITSLFIRRHIATTVDVPELESVG